LSRAGARRIASVALDVEILDPLDTLLLADRVVVLEPALPFR
jgi:hypothetical protein